MKYYLMSQAAEQLHVSKQSIWIWIQVGKIKAQKLGRYWMIPEAELNKVRKEREKLWDTTQSKL